MGKDLELTKKERDYFKSLEQEPYDLPENQACKKYKHSPCG